MKYRKLICILLLIVVVLSACAPTATPAPASPTPLAPAPAASPTHTVPAAAAAPTATVPPAPTATAAPSPTPVALPTVGAFESGEYPNLFRDVLGKSDAEIQEKLDKAWEQLFYGSDTTERVYYPVGEDMAYMKDIGNGDIRSEGMSYGMMIAVQMDKQEEFNRLWKWTKTYMYQSSGPYQGYFAWHCQEDGAQLDPGPAPDGEEWFATALFFASGRWGDGEGIFDYRAEAQAILDAMLHKADGQDNPQVSGMFDPTHKMVVFVPSKPGNTFSDPSYHLPAYYELWALWADKDQDFWKEAAQVSRDYFKKAAHPETGLMPDYADFDGKPHGTDNHKDFRFDAFRAGANVAVDYTWFAADPWQIEQSNRMLDFFYTEGIDSYVNQYSLDGEPLSTDRSTGLIAMNGVAAMASTHPQRQEFIQAVWDASIPRGTWRYYDGLLYQMALLHLSGNFRIYPPKAE